jgi:hypothetical protein
MSGTIEHPVRVAIVTAVGLLASFRPTRIVGEPDRADAHGLADDLLVIAAIVDPVVQAIGDYAQSTLGVSAADVDRYFANQLRGALEGNATYCIIQTLEARGAADCSDVRREMRRS